ncbi:MAG: hypothetical protein H5T62_01730 [Anaerolineae bacterium]|nr:hypothetical protein [Anaerolineae bacterium]
MGFWQKLAALILPPRIEDYNVLWLYVRCDRCGEIIRNRVNLTSEASAAAYDDRGRPTGYLVRKTLVGSRRCYQPIEVTLTLDARRHVVEQAIEGGQFVTAEEYEAQEAEES